MTEWDTWKLGQVLQHLDNSDEKGWVSAGMLMSVFIPVKEPVAFH